MKSPSMSLELVRPAEETEARPGRSKARGAVTALSSKKKAGTAQNSEGTEFAQFLTQNVPARPLLPSLSSKPIVVAANPQATPSVNNAAKRGELALAQSPLSAAETLATTTKKSQRKESTAKAAPETAKEAPLPTSTPARQPSAPTADALALAPPPVMAAPMLEALRDDSSLRLVVQPEHVQLSLRVPEVGDLSLHIHVRGGVANMEVSGEAAHLMEVRRPEMAVALGGAGLALGQFDVNTQGRSRQDEPSTRDPQRSSTKSKSGARISKSERAEGVGPGNARQRHFHVKA